MVVLSFFWGGEPLRECLFSGLGASVPPGTVSGHGDGRRPVDDRARAMDDDRTSGGRLAVAGLARDIAWNGEESDVVTNR